MMADIIHFREEAEKRRPAASWLEPDEWRKRSTAIRILQDYHNHWRIAQVRYDGERWLIVDWIGDGYSNYTDACMAIREISHLSAMKRVE